MLISSLYLVLKVTYQPQPVEPKTCSNISSVYFEVRFHWLAHCCVDGIQGPVEYIFSWPSYPCPEVAGGWTESAFLRHVSAAKGYPLATTLCCLDRIWGHRRSWWLLMYVTKVALQINSRHLYLQLASHIHQWLSGRYWKVLQKETAHQ